MPPIDLNRANLSATSINVAMNALIEHAEPPEQNTRQYLGASSVGSECLRKIQYDWMVDAAHDSRTRDIFRRGHLFEELTRQHLVRAGFVFASKDWLGFFAADDMLQGHADGIIISGPPLPGVGYPCIWEAKCLGERGWKSLERDGLESAYPGYAAQVWLYQAYLDVAEHPAIFTAVNANTCERLHLLHPFNAARAQEWSDRAANVIRATKAGELLPRAHSDPADWRCRFCSHRERCWKSE
jgi:hypothetical protein